jgi:nucleoside-diphosphate-sugar epimerase
MFRDTPLIPETSYGVCKNVIEMIVYDHARKGQSTPPYDIARIKIDQTLSFPLAGFLAARTVRLPTVCVRTGAPSSAASSFISSLIREPLQGEPAVCPIASSPSDPILEEMGIYVTRTKTVVRNIAYAMGLSDEEVVGRVGKLRTMNLPGIKINTRVILDAL